jgi:hypothetical protein
MQCSAQCSAVQCSALCALCIVNCSTMQLRAMVEKCNGEYKLQCFVVQCSAVQCSGRGPREKSKTQEGNYKTLLKFIENINGDDRLGVLCCAVQCSAQRNT